MAHPSDQDEATNAAPRAQATEAPVPSYMTDAAQQQCYTAFKLAHASPAHLHTTTTVRFVGPIPTGWMAAHKKHYLRPRTNYHSCALSFQAASAACGPPDAHGGKALVDAPSASDSEQMAGYRQDRTAHTLAEVNEEEEEALDASPVSTAKAASLKDASPSKQAVLERGKARSTPLLSQPALDNVAGHPLRHATSAVTIPLRDPRSPEESSRPLLSVTSPSGFLSTREASTVSTAASFATAPETAEEQAALFRQSDIDDALLDADSSDSDTATVRAGRVAQVQTEQDGERSAYAVSDESGSSQPHTGSSDMSSNKSLVQHAPPDIFTSPPQLRSSMKKPVDYDLAKPVLMRQDSHLVHFTSSGVQQPVAGSSTSAAVAERLQRTARICVEGQELKAKSQKSQLQHEQGFMNQKILRNPFRKVRYEGELLRAERMLLRIEYAKEGSVPANYSDVMASKLQRRTDMHWREFVLAARPDAEGHVVLHFHRNRTVPALAKKITNIKATREIVLDPKNTMANLYSTLDKTIVLWTTDKRKKRDMIFILRPRTLQTSVEWYAFIQTCLEVKRRRFALLQVPTLGLKLKLELARASEIGSPVSPDDDSEEDDDGISENDLHLNDEGAVLDAEGNPITGNYLIKKCLTLIEQEPCWRPLVAEWRRTNAVGLCWRRYDRLEWLHGPDAQRSIGQWAMSETHELELRPKEHYPTSVGGGLGRKPVMQEPEPIEGFLVRLTSSTGRQSRFGKVFYKRLYFSTHDGLLFYALPTNASPPPPPSFVPGTPAEEAEELVKQSPLIYNVEPYPLAEDGKIAWTRHCDPIRFAKRDKMAVMEAARRVRQLQASTGFLDLTKVVKVRRYKQTRHDAEQGIDHGEDIDFDGTGDDGPLEDVGITDDFDEERVFELVLENGLVVRLQAFNSETRTVWMRHLAKLVAYWKRRLAEDEELLSSMRRENMRLLRIDESIEPLVDLVCNRWEVAHCVSEPKRYNFCSITSCRTIAIQGLLFRKPRVHSTFKRYNCVVSHGKLFVYNHFHYKTSGNIEHHIHNSKRQEIDLSDCYIFSGMITQGDLLDSREDFDREGPGRHALPRLYADGWTSQDDQEALCFVLWTGRRRVALTQLDKKDSGEKKSVSRLGVAGHSMVYLCRCRQERDLWVQIISREIERTAQAGLAAL